MPCRGPSASGKQGLGSTWQALRLVSVNSPLGAANTAGSCGALAEAGLGSTLREAALIRSSISLDNEPHSLWPQASPREQGQHRWLFQTLSGWCKHPHSKPHEREGAPRILRQNTEAGQPTQYKHTAGEQEPHAPLHARLWPTTHGPSPPLQVLICMGWAWPLP